MASKSGKQIRPPGQILSANLSNSAFGFVPASGSKGKSPAVASRGVNVLPDLDLISGFAFLSFASLDQLETHIEHNEAEFASVSVNVGQKRKAEGSIEPHQSTPELYRPANEKKSATTRKIPVKTTAVSSTSDFGVKPKERKSLSKNKTAPVATISDQTERSLTGELDFASDESKTLHHSPNTELEISLLCSETVDLGDEEEMMQLEDCRTSTAGKSRDARDGCSAISSNYMNDVGVADGKTRPDDSKMKKKKKKKRKSEHCDQTSQTKFRIKKKKKPLSQVQDLEGSSNMAADFSVGSKPMDTEFQDADSLSCKTDKVDDDDACNKSQTKGMLSRPKLDRPQCARTSIYQVPNKSSYFKSRNSGSGVHVSSAVNSPVELAQVKNIDKSSLDSLIPNSSDREIDAGDETKSISVLSDFSDHSSDMELFDPHGCFLLNSKIDKVEKEECREGDSGLDVDIETVGKEAKKNFLVVSGIEAGHFSYHPAVTKEGTIDTSIQAYPNEIDIFLQCAKMQEGQLIKIINPDDSLELYSHLTQKGGRDADTIKATRSATERKRRHHLGDLFQDMKLEVFRDVNEADLYFSKQAILSKAITTLEELKKELSDLTNARVKMLKQNKELKEKRNMLMFGKTTVDVDDNKVAAILRHLNINIEEAYEDYTVKKTAEDKEDAEIQEELSESNVSVVEPSAKGRPRASKSLLTPWLLKPHQNCKSNPIRSAVNVVGKSDPQCPEKLKAIHTSFPETHSSLEEKSSNVSCGVQTQAVESGLSKSPQVENSTLSQMLLRDNEIKSVPLSEATRLANLKHSLAESSPKVIHTVTFTSSQSKPAVKTVIGLPFGVKAQETRIDSSKPSGSKSSTQSQASLTDDHTMKITPVDKQASHEGPKPSLVKILPKPAIIHLDSLQQKAIMESLGQVKQPSSDKIICNLSRLSTQASPSTPSRICIIRSGQLMKSLDSKNVMHIKITNDVLKSLDTGSISGIPGVSSSTINQPSSGIKTDPSVHSVCNPQNPEVPISVAHVSTMTATQKLLLPATTAQTLLTGVQNPVLTTSTTHVPMVASACNFVLPTSTTQICPVPGVQNPMVLTSTTLTPSMAGAQRPLVLTSTPQIVSVAQVPQKPTDRTLPLSQIPLTSTTTSAPKFIFSREPLNFLPAPGHVQGLPSAHETSSDVTLRALASLNQLQANKPAPPIETVTAQPDSNRNPATGYLIDLKNVVMKVGSVGSATPSTTPLETPMIAGTTSLKGSATNQISEMSLNSVPLKQVAMSSVSTTVLASPVISFPSSVPPAISAPSSMLPGISVPSTKLLNISVPSSTSLNTSFTMSAVTDPVASTGTAISSDVDTIVAPLINPCLESFNFMPEQLAKPTPALSSEISVLSSSVDIQKQATESGSTASHPISLGDMFKPETSSSSTVLTQEMLKIPGIKQSSEVSSMLLNPVDLPLTDVFPDLVEIDTLKDIDSVNLEGAPSSVNKKITGGSDTGSVKQASLPTYSLRSSSGDTSKLTSPTKGSVRDSKREKSLAKR